MRRPSRPDLTRRDRRFPLTLSLARSISSHA
jgi:hypothetical protein